MLQVDAPLICAAKQAGLKIAIESNGSLPVPRSIDWICISPKAGAPFVQRSGDELKLVYPQSGISPQELEVLDFKEFFLQPMDGKDAAANTAAAVEYCRTHPNWRLSLQIHKIVGLP
jgi:organic radical activating enzyme